jgi:GNAT superfamily N-acetyltransferase
MVLDFRFAQPGEASLLSQLAFASKAYWPYELDYLIKVRPSIQITPEEIAKWPVIVGLQHGKIVGFSAVCEVKCDNMLDHLWVKPDLIGRGIGGALFAQAVFHAKTLGWAKFLILSDPYAEPFYLKLGAKRIGLKASTIKPGLFLPILEYHF